MRNRFKIAVISVLLAVMALMAGMLFLFLNGDKFFPDIFPDAPVSAKVPVSTPEPGADREPSNVEPKVSDAVPTAEPDSSGTDEGNSGQETEQTGENKEQEVPGGETPAPMLAAADEEVEAYLEDSVFIGDSITLGYRNYCRKSEDATLNAIRFLAAGSFSAHNAMWPVSEKSVHPLYQGEQHPVWESVALMGADKVFICLGLNDLNIDEYTCEYYKIVIDNILEASPGADIHVISMPYTLKDMGKGKLNNDGIREYNLKLKEMTTENGWGFLDITTPLEDGEGNLAPEFCSDGFLHQNPAAYKIWTEELRRYLKEKLSAAEPEENKVE